MPTIKLTSALLSGIPAVAMFAGTAIGLWRQPSARATAASQHFAAGLVFAAVASELLPDLLEPQRSTVAVVLGFAMGVTLMLLLKWLVGEHEDGDDDAHGHASDGGPRPPAVRAPSTGAERTALLTAAAASPVSTAAGTDGVAHSHATPQLVLNVTDAPDGSGAGPDGTRTPATALPWGLVTGVAVDVFVDGTLVAIAFFTGAGAGSDAAGHDDGDDVRRGAVLAFALGFEILFLGLSMCASLRARGATGAKTLGVGVGCALLVVLGVVLGSAVMQAVSGAVMDAFLSFGVSALLWLIEEELMREAHEPAPAAGGGSGDKEPTAVTVCFFAGFLAVVLMRRLVE